MRTPSYTYEKNYIYPYENIPFGADNKSVYSYLYDFSDKIAGCIQNEDSYL